jgi:hypothetical protein
VGVGTGVGVQAAAVMVATCSALDPLDKLNQGLNADDLSSLHDGLLLA